MNVEERLDAADEASFEKLGRRLSKIERIVLTGCLQDQTYETIADISGYSLGYINRTIAPQLWSSLSQTLGEKVTKKNVRFCLERYTRSQASASSSPQPSQLSDPSPSPVIDWGEAIDVSIFYGRQTELDRLTQWIMVDRCRLIAILGMGGMGKTALSVKLAQGLIQTSAPNSQPFEFVVWRSLRHAPPLETLLTDLVAVLSHQQATKTTMSKLIQCLRESRCLVVLDNLETLLDEKRVGRFRSDFAEYGELFRLLGEVGHQSCVVLTSREKPTHVAVLEGVEFAVRSLKLDGSPEAAQAIIKSKGLMGTEEQRQVLADRYSNSPLALKITSTSICELFDGDIAAFLQEDTLIFNGVRRLLDQQFKRLSDLEQSIMYWLAINQEWTTIADLQQDMLPGLAKGRLLETLETLSLRSLIEKRHHHYTQQPVVMEYVIDALLERWSAEIVSTTPNLILSHAILKAQAPDYIRTSQVRLIMEPLLDRIRSHCPEIPLLTQHLQQLLAYLHQHSSLTPQPPTSGNHRIAGNYGAGNLLNLCHHLNIDVTGYDFSDLLIRQAYLTHTPLHLVNFTGATFDQTDWAQSISQPLCLAYSPDDTSVAIGCQDGNVYFWNTTTYQQWRTLSAHQSWVFSVAVSPDGQWLATGSFDRTVKLWHIPTGNLITALNGHPDGVVAVRFSPDGHWLASGGDCGTVKLWNLKTQTCQHTLRWQGGWVRAIAFHPTAPWLLTGSDDGTLQIWDIASGQSLKCFGTGVAYRCLAVHPSGRLLAASGLHPIVQVWDLETITCLHSLAAHSSPVWDVAYSPDGQWLASSGDDGDICLWQTDTGNRAKTLRGHRIGVWAIAFDLASQYLVSASSNELTLRLWSVADGHCLRVIQSQLVGFYCLSCHRATGQLVCGGHNFQVQRWNLASQEFQQHLVGHQNHIWGLAFHPSGHWVASAALDGDTRIWDISSGTCIQMLRGHQHWVLATAFHPEGTYLATGGSDQTICLWDWQTGTCLQVLQGHQGFIETLTFHPQGWLISAGDDQTIKIWQPETGDCLQTLAGHTGRIWQIAISPDGQWLASGSDDQTIRLWDLTALQPSSPIPLPCYVLKGHSASVFGLTFSPDGQGLASGGGDRTIRLWNIATQQCRSVFSTGDSFIAALEFCEVDDRLLLVSGSFNHATQLWDPALGNCIATLQAKRLYEGMTITDVVSMTDGQKAVLKQLGAIDLG